MKRKLLPAGLAIAALVAGFVFREPLVAWFTLQEAAGESTAPAASGHAGHEAAPPAPESAAADDGATATPALPSRSFAPPALEALKRALAAQERARALLARDESAGLGEQSKAIAAALREARAALAADGAEPFAAALEAGAAAAEALAGHDGTTDLEAARKQYGEVSRHLVALAMADPRLRSGWHLFECPMAQGYRKWIQRSPQIQNPYMGTRMLACGSESPWDPPPPPEPIGISHDGHGHEGSDIAFYTCPMHPSVKQHEPGVCPSCGMDLTPVTYDEHEGGVVFVDAVRRQQIGVKTGRVERRPMRLRIRAVGRVTYDERRLHDVTLKLKGWIEDLDVNETGQRIEAGQRLFTLYSPELYAAQQEYLLALRSHRTSKGSRQLGSLVEAAEERLRLWDVSPGVIRSIARRGKPLRAVPFHAPASGYVIEKDVVEGAAVEPGKRLFRIAALDPIWVEAEVYESDLPHLRPGQPARITLSYLPGREIEGTVAYVYPFLDPKSRTGRVRIELPNPEGALKPAMYANVEMHVDLGERLQVPESAVLYTGPRNLVFLDLGEGRLRPQEVKLGLEADGAYEVLEGLREGQIVVTSGNFLVAAESRIRSAAAFWGTADDGKGGAGAKGGGGHAGH